MTIFDNLFAQVRTPVLFTRHRRTIDPDSGQLLGAMTVTRAEAALELMRSAGGIGAVPRIGPVTAIPKLLKNHGLRVDDIGLWELNEAFAWQAA